MDVSAPALISGQACGDALNALGPPLSANETAQTVVMDMASPAPGVIPGFVIASVEPIDCNCTNGPRLPDPAMIVQTTLNYSVMLYEV